MRLWAFSMNRTAVCKKFDRFASLSHWFDHDNTMVARKKLVLSARLRRALRTCFLLAGPFVAVEPEEKGVPLSHFSKKHTPSNFRQLFCFRLPTPFLLYFPSRAPI